MGQAQPKEKVGPVSAQNIFILFLGGAGPDQLIGLSQNWPGPNVMLNYLQKRE
jgi:hypothetical protein